MSREPCLCGDPECKRCFPFNTLELKRYWVELLDDTGLQSGHAIDAYDEDDAEILAFAEAKEHGLRPAEIVSITENDE